MAVTRSKACKTPRSTPPLKARHAEAARVALEELEVARQHFVRALEKVQAHDAARRAKRGLALCALSEVIAALKNGTQPGADWRATIADASIAV